MEPENTPEYEPLFDPTDPGEKAAKDQILTMLAGKWEAFNAISHMDSASLKDWIQVYRPGSSNALRRTQAPYASQGTSLASPGV